MPDTEKNFVDIPDVSGLSKQEAEDAFENLGLYSKSKRSIRDIPGARVVENGQVITSNPAPGSRVPAGSQVIYFTKVNRLLFVTSVLAAILSLLAVAVVLASVLNPDPLVKEEKPVDIKPDENKVLPGGSGTDRVGGVFVVPTFYKQQASVGSNLYPLTVKNNSAIDQDLNFYFVPLAGNSLTGTPRVKVTKDTIKEGDELVELSKSKATLGPGKSTTVGIKLISTGNAPEVYGAVIVEYDREKETKASDEVKGGVKIKFNNIYQITAVRIAEVSPGTEAGRVLQVRGSQGEDEDGVFFSARVLNTGDVLGSPTGVIEIFNQGGGLVKNLPLEASQGILPENEREVTAVNSELVKGLSPGNYLARATVRFGQDQSQADWNFEIASDGKLPSPAGEAAAQASPYNPGPGEGFIVDTEVLNTGTATYSPKLTIKIVPFGQDKVIEEKEVTLGEIGPGERARGSFDFSGIDKIGNYEALVTVESNDKIYLSDVVASILVEDGKSSEPSLYAKIRDWMSANPLGTMVIGAAFLAFLVGLVMFVLNYFSRRRQGFK